MKDSGSKHSPYAIIQFLLLLLYKKLQAVIFVMCFVEGSPAWKPSGCALAPIMDLFSVTTVLPPYTWKDIYPIKSGIRPNLWWMVDFIRYSQEKEMMV